MLTSGPIENILVDAVKAKYAEQSDDEVSVVKFIYSEKATKLCKISTNYLTGSK